MDENEDKLANMAKNKTKDVTKDVARKGVKLGKKALNKSLKLAFGAVAKLVALIVSKILIILLPVILILILIAAFVYILKQDDSDKMTATGKSSITTVLNLSDISELVTINGTPKGGYSLAFVDDIDDKLEEVIDSDKQYKAIGIKDVSTLKEYIKAELVTQLPYLGDGVSKSKLPDLDGVDILSEALETSDTKQVSSMDGFLMIGDSITVRVKNTGMLKECEFSCVSGKSPSYWNNDDVFKSLPSDVNGVCIMLGVNNLSEAPEMKQLIEKLLNKYPGKPIYVQRVLPIGRSYSGAATLDKINNYNDTVKKYCDKTDNVYWIDTSDGYVDDSGYLINASDGLHPDDCKTLVTNIKNKIVSGRGTALGSSSSSGELQGSNAKEAVWGFLIGQGFSEQAVAGMMGNFSQESGFQSNNVQNSYENRVGNDEQYTNKVNNGSYSKEQFSTDSAGYGLAQWTYETRKADFYDFAKEKGTGIDDLKMQLEFLMWEMENKYQSLLEDSFKKISDVSDAAVTFHNVFEGSRDTESQIQERVDDAKVIYNEFQGTVPSGVYSSGSSKKKSMAVTDRNVSKKDEFQGAVKLKRVIPDKNFGELSEVNGNVIDMTYVPQGVFNAYLNQQNENVLEVFTINNNREIVFAKWTYENGELRLSQGSSVDLSTVMEKYTMPYDYLMMLNVYGEDVAFCRGLAKLAIDSEYIVAIQDQVITTYTKTNKVQTVYDEDTQTTYQVDLGTTEKLLEQDSQKVELTYADSWAITVSNDVTYKDDDTAIREDVASTSSGPTSTTEGDITTTVTSSSVTNKYLSGKTTVNEEEGGDKFVELYEKCDKFKLIEPDWLFEALNSNAKTTKMVDLTKYLLYKATSISYGVKEPKEVFSEYEDNEFKEINKEKQTKGTVGWAFTRAWENNTLRKYMLDDGTYTYDSSTYIYSCVTEDRSKYILYDDIGHGQGNKNYGIGVRSYDVSTGLKWQNVDLFKENGINIKESEYNVYGESQIDVEIIDKISVDIWNNYKERVERIVEARGLELESYQIDCLTDILYKNGSVYKVLSAYQQYGLDEEKIKGACEEEFSGERGNARWILFSEGRYSTPIEGEDLDPDDYAGGNGDILEACEAVTKMLLERKATYSLETPPLIRGNIAKQLKEGKSFCCATYVSSVLYYSGALTEDQINAYNYHYTGSGGIPDMLKAAGWRQVSASEIQPGDVVNKNSVHVLIYAGDGQFWDQTSGVVSSSGSPPRKTTVSYNLSGCEIWRAP